MRADHRLFAVLLALALPVFFLFLGANSVWDANEAFYVETPRQMVRTGDYVNPSFNDRPRFNKPVLSYWIVAGLYHVAGDAVAVERLGIAVGAAAIVLSAFLIGRAMRSTLVGIIAALMVATAPRVVWFSRKIFIDVYLTTFLSLALAAFVLAECRPDRRRRYLIGMYVALGLAVLTKGPVALALPGLALVVWLAVERRLSDIGRLMLPAGAAIVLAIVLPWYVAVYVQHGWEHITQFVFEENLQRYATTAMTPGGRDATFYLPVLFGELFPWAPMVIVPIIGIAAAWWRTRGVRLHADPARGPGLSLLCLLWIWIAAFVVVFSFSQTKEDLYIFPVIPAVAVLVAIAVVDSFSQPAPRLLTAMFVFVCVLCVAAAPALYWLFGPSAGYYALPETREFSIVLALTGAASLALWIRARRAHAVAALALGFAVLNYLFAGRVLPGVERSKPVPPLVRTINARAAPNVKLGYFRVGLQSFVYYADRGRIEEIGSPEQAKAFFYDDRDSWAIMGQGEWEEVRALVPHVCIADRHPLSVFDAKLGSIIQRRPPADVLLVKNHCDK